MGGCGKMIQQKDYKFWFCTGSQDLTVEQMADWAELVGIEALIIDQNTTIPGIKRDIKLGELFYQ